MRTINSLSIILLLLLTDIPVASAQPDSLSTTVTTYQIGAGTTHVLDTYLSQEKFQGAGATFLITTVHGQPHRNWATLTEHQVNLAETHDRAGISNELQGDYTLFTGRLRSWHLSCFHLQAGALAALNLGFIYNTSNSNNPAQGRLSLLLMPTASATYRLPVRRWPAQLRYELNLPLAGLMFSPNYGQSYYEIFTRGNYDHNVVPTTFLSSPTLRQQLTLQAGLSPRFTLLIGYLGDYQQARVNNLKSHLYSHRLMIGLVRKFSIINHCP